MQQDPPELLTTLRDVAATAVSFLDALAHAKRERSTAPTAAPPQPPQVPPTPPIATTPIDAVEVIPPAPPCDAPGAFLLTAIDRSDDNDDPDLPVPRDIDFRRQLTEHHVRALEREYQLLQQRRMLAERTTSIHQHLFAISDLVGTTLDTDRPRVLAVLDATLGRLEAELRGRSGPFAADSDSEMVG